MTGPVAESLGVLVAFSAGLFSFLSPCVLPLFPSYLSFVTGMSVDRLTSDVSVSERSRIFLHSLAFIAGFTAVFVSLGASFSAAGQFFLEYIAGFFQWGPLSRTRQLQIRSKPAGFIGSFAVGLTFAIGWTPCVGPILGSILTLASSESTVRHGVGLLLAYSAGLGVPFLAFSFGLGFFLRFFKRYRPFIPVVERAAGILLVVVGVLVATNYYILLNSWTVSITPEWLLRRL